MPFHTYVTQNDFLEKLKTVDLPSYIILGTFKVSGLDTSIDIYEGIDGCYN